VNTPTPTVGGRVDGQRDFPEALHVCGYDVRGTYLDTGDLRRTRETGLVAHTHQLLRGLAQRHPDTRAAPGREGGTRP
jgi:hypothetical protein